VQIRIDKIAFSILPPNGKHGQKLIVTYVGVVLSQKQKKRRL